MKKAFLGFVVSVATAASLFSAEYSIDVSHSSIGFSVKHLMVSNVKGYFKTFDGAIVTDDKTHRLTKLEGTVDTASVDTDIQKRDDHLKSADFFDSAKHPKMSFVMTKLTPLKGEKAKVAGNLTIKGVTKPIVFDAEVTKPVEDMQGNKRIGISMNSKINRKDFGLNWNKTLEAGGFVVGDEVKINIELEGIEK